MLQEFKKFAMRGSVVDLAIGVIIGAAFGKIIDSLVKDVMMPPIGRVLGRVDFKDLFVPLDGNTYKSLDEATKSGAPVIAYGQFVNNIITFVIIAFCVFLLVKGMNTLRRRLEEQPPLKPATPSEPTLQEKLLTEIRDLLKAKM